MKKTILFLATLLAVAARAQNTGMVPLGAYVTFGEEGDYWHGVKELFMDGHDFEYAYFAREAQKKEKALLIGSGSLTLVELDNNYWTWYHDQYIRPAELRKGYTKPSSTALTVPCDSTTARELLRLIDYAASTASYRNHRYVLDGSTYSFIPKSKYAPAAETKNMRDCPTKQLIELLDKAVALVKEGKASALPELRPAIQECRDSYDAFLK